MSTKCQLLKGNGLIVARSAYMDVNRQKKINLSPGNNLIRSHKPCVEANLDNRLRGRPSPALVHNVCVCAIAFISYISFRPFLRSFSSKIDKFKGYSKSAVPIFNRVKQPTVPQWRIHVVMHWRNTSTGSMECKMVSRDEL